MFTLNNQPGTRSSSQYFRQALRAAKTVDQAKSIGLQMAREMDNQRKFAEGRGMELPSRFILSTEAEDRGLIPKAVF